MSTHNQRTGFTLVELLISISILAVLAAMVIIILNPISYFKRSRDSRRKGDLQLIQVALELYHQDIGYYPDSQAFTEITGTDAVSLLLEAGYIKSVPVDPVNTGAAACGSGSDYSTEGYSYWYKTGSASSSTDFVLIAPLETSSNNSDSPCASLDSTIFDCTSSVAITNYCYGIENQF